MPSLDRMRAAAASVRWRGHSWLNSVTPQRRTAMFRVVGVAFWAMTTLRLVSTYTGPHLHVDYLIIWGISGAGYLIGIACWLLPWGKSQIEPMLGTVIVGIALPVLYLSFTGSLKSKDLLSVYIAAAVFTAALLPLRTAMAAALLGAVAAAIPLLAGWTAYYDRSLLVLVSVIGLLTYVQARMLGTVGMEKRKAETGRRELEDSYMATITALAASIYAKDRTSEAHSRGTAALAVAVGHRMHLDGEALRLLEYAALLHDIGKMGLPGYVLNKPGPLSPDELRVVREHPLIAERILSSVPFLKPVCPVIRAQNEQWDGSGYPDGLAGEAIPLAARILHACAAYHAMTSERPYRPRLTDDAMTKELQTQAGKQFDPHVVTAVLDVLAANELTAIPSRGGGKTEDASGTPRYWHQQLETIEGLGTRIGEQVGIPQLFEAVAESITSLLPHDHFRIMLVAAEGSRLEPAFASKATLAEYEGLTVKALSVPIGEGIAGWVARTRRPLVLGDTAKHAQAVHIAGSLQFKESMIAVPIQFRGKVLGVIVVVKVGLDQYTHEHLRLLTILANQLAPNLAYARLVARAYTAA